MSSEQRPGGPSYLLRVLGVSRSTPSQAEDLSAAAGRRGGGVGVECGGGLCLWSTGGELTVAAVAFSPAFTALIDWTTFSAVRTSVWSGRGVKYPRSPRWNAASASVSDRSARDLTGCCSALERKQQASTPRSSTQSPSGTKARHSLVPGTYRWYVQ